MTSPHIAAVALGDEIEKFGSYCTATGATTSTSVGATAVVGVLFGCWYALGAVNALPYWF